MSKFNISSLPFSDKEDDKRAKEELHKNMKELRRGLNRGLTFSDQFKSFLVDVDISAQEEAQIRNQLGRIPTEWMCVDACNADRGALKRGIAAWDANYLYIRNTGVYDGTFRLRFFEGETDQPELDADTETFPAIVGRFATGSSGYTVPNTSTGRQVIPLTSEAFDPASRFSLSSNLVTIDLKGTYKAKVQMDNLQGNTAMQMYVRNNTQSSDAAQFLNVALGTGQENPTREIEFSVPTSSEQYSIEWVTISGSTTMSTTQVYVTFERM